MGAIANVVFLVVVVSNWARAVFFKASANSNIPEFAFKASLAWCALAFAIDVIEEFSCFAGSGWVLDTFASASVIVEDGGLSYCFGCAV